MMAGRNGRCELGISTPLKWGYSRGPYKRTVGRLAILAAKRNVGLGAQDFQIWPAIC